MLKKGSRLLTNYEFNKVRRQGKRYKTDFLTIYYLDVSGYDGPSRFGIVIPNKFSKSAVVRNRVKRVFREVIRLNIDKILDGFWIVIYPAQVSEDKGYEVINEDFNKVLSKVSLAR